MIEVRFNDVKQYLAELEACSLAGEVEGRLVRVTHQTRSTRHAPFREWWVNSTFVARGQLVRLERHVGEYVAAPGNDGANVKVRAHAEAVIDLVQRAATRLNLDCRPGVLMVVSGQAVEP